MKRDIRGNKNPNFKNARIDISCCICKTIIKRFRSTIPDSKKVTCSKLCYSKYCSIRSKRIKKPLINIKCTYCSNYFDCEEKRIKKSKILFCSLQCLGKYKQIEQVWRKRISKSCKGRKAWNKDTNGPSGKDHPHYKNGKYISYRLIYEKYYNIKLQKGEIIHHIDGNKYNNHISNLFKCKDSKKHLTLHRSLEYIGYKLLKKELIVFDSKLGKYLLNKNKLKYKFQERKII